MVYKDIEVISLLPIKQNDIDLEEEMCISKWEMH